MSRECTSSFGHRCSVNVVCIIKEANLIDVELGQSGVEHEVEVVEHRHDLHRRTFAGQLSERHDV